MWTIVLLILVCAVAIIVLLAIAIYKRRVTLKNTHLQIETQRFPKKKENQFPLTSAQERLWFSYNLEPNKANYNLDGYINLQGKLDIAALTKAINAVVRRHDALRATFHSEEGQTYQTFESEVNIKLTQFDLINIKPALQKTQIAEIIKERRQLRYDLTKGPLLRTILIRLSEDEHVLGFEMHHICCDGYSFNLFYKELGKYYDAYHNDAPADLLPLSLHYGDYTLLHREYLASNSYCKHLDYWKKRLEDAPQVIHLQTDKPRSKIDPFKAETLGFEITKSLRQSIEKFSKAQETTPFNFFITALALLLHIYSRDQQINIGVPIVNRHTADENRLIGLFANTVVMNFEIRKDLSVAEFLHSSFETVSEAIGHQQAGFEDIVNNLNLERDLTRHPLFQVSLNKLPAPVKSTVQMGELKGVVFEAATGTLEYDLAYEISDTDEGYYGEIIYNSKIFTPQTIERLQTHYIRLLEEMVNHPEKQLKKIALLNEEENEQILIEWNQTSQDYPKDKSLVDLFEIQAKQKPDNIAVVYEKNQMTYRELNEKANQLAHYLIDRGITSNGLVGLCLERSVEMLICIVAILKAGAAYVPIDPHAPSDRVKVIFEDANLFLLISTQAIASVVDIDPKKLLFLEQFKDILQETPIKNLSQQISPNDYAYVIYTSGSTGKPKGVLVTHHNVCRLFYSTNQWYGFNEGDVWTLFHSYAFDFSVWEIWGALLFGGKLVVVPFDVSRSPSDFYQLLIKEKVTVLNQTPSAFKQLIQHEKSEDNVDALSLRYVIFGGEALEFSSLKEWFERHGDQKPQLINMYGITETTVHVTYQPIRHQDVKEKRGSLIGERIPDLTLYILDENRIPVPVGIPGEMYVGGPGVTRGYLNQPELTNERFIDNPFGDKTSKLYKTGDLARWLADGNIEYLGRIDFQVKIRGFRIELGEIESDLLAHPAIQEAVVLAREDEPGIKRLVAYYVFKPNEDVEVSALRDYLKEKLPDYMVPSFFIKLEKLPLTPNGKLDRKNLPQPEYESQADEYIAPETEAEKFLVEIWKEVLSLDRVGIQDDFFAIGGDSLISIRAVAKIKNAGFSLSVKDILEHRTIAALARILKQKKIEIQYKAFDSISEEELRLLDLNRDLINDVYPATYLQNGMLFESSMHNEDGTYHDVFSYYIHAPFDLEKAKVVLQNLINKHALLRAYFKPSEKGYWLVEQKQANASDKLTLLEGQTDVHALIHSERLNIFNIQNAGLFRFFIANIESDKFCLIFSFHHAITDGWSVASLIAEFTEAYVNLQDVIQTSMPSFANVRLQESKAIMGEGKSFWQKYLQDYEVITDKLLVYAKAEENLKGNLLTSQYSLTSDQSQALFDLARKLEVSIDVILLSLYQINQSIFFNREDIALGVVVNIRLEEEGGDKLFGLHLNTLPLRQEVDLKDLKGQILETSRQHLMLQKHRFYPYGKIKSDLKERSDLYHAMFNYIHFHSLENSYKEKLITEGEQFEKTNFPLALNAIRFSNSLELKFIANSSFISQFMLDKLLKQMAFQLEEVKNNIDLITSSSFALKTLPDADFQLIVNDWNQTTASYATNKTVIDLFEEQVELKPDNIAVAFEGTQLSYLELHLKSNQLAHFLKEKGVGPEVFVGICMERSIEMQVCLLGILKAGGTYVALDPDYPIARLDYIVENSSIHLVLNQSHLKVPFENKNLTLINIDLQSGMLSKYSTKPIHRDLFDPQQTAYILYTSGSTGLPKGVAIPHVGLTNRILWMQEQYHLTPQDNVLQKTPYSFDVSGWEFFWPMIVGARLVFAIPGGHKDPNYLIKLIQQENITTLHFVPSMLEAFLRNPEVKKCKSIKYVFCSGEELKKSQEITFFEQLPHAELHNLYGPTEATIDVTFWQCGKDRTYDFIPIGRAVANTQLYILNSNGMPVPIGVPGELHIAGIQLAKGYYNRQDLTNAAFIPNPFSSDESARMYKTGDLCSWLPDGNIRYLGRTDFQVKLRGFRIELGEIESNLCTYPGINDAVALVREDVPGDKRLVAYFQFLKDDPSESPTFTSLSEHLKKNLPDYMIPSFFVQVDKFPLTSSGKLNRKALPAPEYTRTSEYIEPRTIIEKQLASIWQEVLGIPKVGLQDIFLDAGGNSLLLIQVHYRINALYPNKVSFVDLFKQSIEGLSEIIEKNPSMKQRSLILMQEGKNEKALYLIHAIGGNIVSYASLVQELGKARPVYGLQSPGLFDKSSHLDSVEKMAEHYINEIKSVQPSGPYHLAGWSFGGAVVFEMARQLCENGEMPKEIFLFDSYAPEWFQETTNGLDETKILIGFAKDLANTLNKPLLINEKDLHDLDRERQLSKVLEALHHAHVITSQEEIEGLKQHYAVYRNNLRALLNYHPKPIPTDIILFAAEKDPDMFKADPDLSKDTGQGWRNLCKNIIIQPVTGDHYSILNKANVKTLAKSIQNYLDLE